jgi:hypothetical protein
MNKGEWYDNGNEYIRKVDTNDLDLGSMSWILSMLEGDTIEENYDGKNLELDPSYGTNKFHVIPREKNYDDNDFVSKLAKIGGDDRYFSYYRKPKINPDGSLEYGAQMRLPNGKYANGVIRISDHQTDIGRWSKKNKEYLFGISIVVGLKPREKEDTNVRNGKTYTVYEYITKENANEEALINIARTIFGIGKGETEWNPNMKIGGVEPILRQNEKNGHSELPNDSWLIKGKYKYPKGHYRADLDKKFNGKKNNNESKKTRIDIIIENILKKYLY